MRIYQPQDYKGRPLATIDDLQNLKIPVELLPVDESYNPESKNPQAGTAVAEAVEGLASKEDLEQKADKTDLKKFEDHIADTDIHVTAEKKAEWDAKVDTDALEAAKSELEDAINQKVGEPLRYKGSVSTESELPKEGNSVGDFYHVEDTGANYAWSGERWDKLSENLEGLVTKDEFNEHANNATIHVTAKDKTKWNQVENKADSTLVAALTSRVSELEGTLDPVVDQAFNALSTHAQSGLAVAEAIKPLATTKALTTATENINRLLTTKANQADLTEHVDDTVKHVTAEEKASYLDKYTKSEADAKLAKKSDKTELEALAAKVGQLESGTKTTVDQTYKSTSENAQSGKAVAEALKTKVDTKVIGTKGTFSVINDEDSADLKFEQTDGSASGIGVKDGSNGLYAQIYAHNADLRSNVRFNVKQDGIYYTKNQTSSNVTADDEIVTKRDIKSLSELSELSSHLSDEVRHITAEERTKWNKVEEKADQSVVDSLQSEVESVKGVTDTVGEAVKDLATKEEVAGKANKAELDELKSGVDNFESLTATTLESLEDRIDHAEEHIKAEAVTLNHHIMDQNIHVTVEDKARWDKVGEKADASTLQDITERLQTLEERPSTDPEGKIIIDQTYNPESINAQSGRAVAEAVKDLATKTEVEGKADKDQLSTHILDANIHVTTEDKEKWNKVDNLEQRVQSIEGGSLNITVDQSYNDESANAQSGTAVAEAIEPLATIASVASLETRVETLEKIPGLMDLTVDQTYDPESDNPLSGQAVAEALKTVTIEVDQTYDAESTKPQSGTAVAEAVKEATDDKIVKVIQGSAGTSYMNNETNGGLMKFTKTDGSFGKVTLFDASDGEQTFIQLVASTQDKSKIAKVHLTTGGAYYSKESSGAVATEDNEIATKKDLRELAPEDLGIEVDQTYSAISENPQSGKAVAEALKTVTIDVDQTYDAQSAKPQSGKAVAEGLAAHTSNEDIHVTKEKKAEWDGLSGRVDVLEAKPEITVDQTYNAESTDPQSGTAVAEAIGTVESKVTQVEQSVTKLLSGEEGVDQSITPDSQKPVSGKAVNDAIESTKSEITEELGNYVQTEVDGATGQAFIFNEADGGGAKFTTTSGDVSFVGVNDGSDGLFAQIYAKNQDASEIVRLNVQKDGIYYTKNTPSPTSTADDELATKKDLKALTPEGIGLTVDQTYSAESTNPQSGTAVAEALKTVKIDVDQTYDAESTKPQSGTAVAEAVADKVIKTIQTDLGTAYLNNETNGGLMKFTKADGSMSKVTLFDASDGEQTRIQLVAHNADQSAKTRLHLTAVGAYYSNATSGAVATTDNELVTKKDISSLPTSESLKAVTDKIPSEASAENQLADKKFVQDTVRNNAAHFRGSWATFADVPSDPTQYPADTDQNTKPNNNDYLVVLKDENHEDHTWEYRYSGAWDTAGKDGWKAIYEISSAPLTDEQFAALDSGITKEKVDAIDQKAEKTDLDKYVLKEITGGTGKAEIFNEADGGGSKFTTLSGDVSFVGVNDGSGDNHNLAQIYAKNQDGSEIVRLNVQRTGIYYTKNADSPASTADDELVVKKDLTAVETKLGTAQDTLDKLLSGEEGVDQSITPDSQKPVSGKAVHDAIEAAKTIVDQTYDAESENAQAGKAVADAIKGKVDISLEGEKGTSLVWQDPTGAMLKFTQKTGQVAGVCVNDGTDDIYAQLYAKDKADSPTQAIRLNVGLDGIYYTKNAATPGEHSADDELATKKDLKALAPEDFGIAVDQTYSATSENPQSGKAVAEAVADKIVKTIKGEAGTAYMNNETNGGLIKFTANDGSFGKVTLYDASDSEHTFVQIVASTEDKSSIAKIHLTTTGAYYVTTSSGAVAVEDNEILTKKSLTDLTSQVQSVKDQLDALAPREITEELDLDTLRSTGRFVGSKGTLALHHPAEIEDDIIVVDVTEVNGKVRQTYSGGGIMAVRRYEGSTWSAWQQLKFNQIALVEEIGPISNEVLIDTISEVGPKPIDEPVSLDGTDLDNLKTTGKYIGSSGTVEKHHPVEIEDDIITVDVVTLNEKVRQFYTAGDIVATRKFDGSAWEAWSQLQYTKLALADDLA